MDNLTWLDNFFANLTDGEWESEYGLTIESVNNPGWMVRIDLDGTGLNPSTFRPITDQRDDRNWIECKVQDGVWLGGGGVGNLDEVLTIFRAWVEGGAPAIQKEPFKKQNSQDGRPFRPNRRPGNRR